MTRDDAEPPYDHGSQPVPEHPTPPPAEGRSAIQVVTIVIGVLALVAGVLWFLVPLIG